VVSIKKYPLIVIFNVIASWEMMKSPNAARHDFFKIAGAERPTVDRIKAKVSLLPFGFARYFGVSPALAALMV
jgi:hypothetical protein